MHGTANSTTEIQYQLYIVLCISDPSSSNPTPSVIKMILYFKVCHVLRLIIIIISVCVCVCVLPQKSNISKMTNMMCRVHEKQYKSEERKRTAKERGRERERERERGKERLI